MKPCFKAMVISTSKLRRYGNWYSGEASLVVLISAGDITWCNALKSIIRCHFAGTDSATVQMSRRALIKDLFPKFRSPADNYSFDYNGAPLQIQARSSHIFVVGISLVTFAGQSQFFGRMSFLIWRLEIFISGTVQNQRYIVHQQNL